MNLSNNLDWWIEGPASRNYFSSPLFHYCCSFVLLEKLATQKKIPKRVIVDSKAFCKILKTWINDNGYNLQVFQRPRIDETLIKFYFGGILRTLNSSLNYFYRTWLPEITEFHTKRLIFQPLILIDTFVLEKSEVKDRYYPGLWENLDPSDKKRTFFVPEFERNTISKIRKTIDILNLSEKKYLFKWEFLRIEDYFYAFTHYFRLRKIQVPPSIFRGIQFKELIQEELFTGLNSGMAMKAILNYRFFRRLKKLDIKIETAINWFENQGLDKDGTVVYMIFFLRQK